jgi:hypothetical protein
MVECGEEDQGLGIWRIMRRLGRERKFEVQGLEDLSKVCGYVILMP